MTPYDIPNKKISEIKKRIKFARVSEQGDYNESLDGLDEVSYRMYDYIVKFFSMYLTNTIGIIIYKHDQKVSPWFREFGNFDCAMYGKYEEIYDTIPEEIQSELVYIMDLLV